MGKSLSEKGSRDEESGSRLAGCENEQRTGMNTIHQVRMSMLSQTSADCNVWTLCALFSINSNMEGAEITSSTEAEVT